MVHVLGDHDFQAFPSISHSISSGPPPPCNVWPPLPSQTPLVCLVQLKIL